MELKLPVLVLLYLGVSDALFTPRCLWGGLMGDLGGGSGERWLRDTSRTRDSRVRRFLWTEKDVCDWMCKEDYGLEVRDVCRRCCPDGGSSTTQRTPTTAARETSRAPRSTTLTDGTSTASPTAPATDTTSTTAGSTTSASTP